LGYAAITEQDEDHDAEELGEGFSEGQSYLAPEEVLMRSCVVCFVDGSERM
jgi:hypothetical protein